MPTLRVRRELAPRALARGPSIRTKIVALALVPLLVAGVLGAGRVLELQEERDSAAEHEVLLATAESLSELKASLALEQILLLAEAASDDPAVGAFVAAFQDKLATVRATLNASVAALAGQGTTLDDMAGRPGAWSVLQEDLDALTAARAAFSTVSLADGRSDELQAAVRDYERVAARIDTIIVDLVDDADPDLVREVGLLTSLADLEIASLSETVFLLQEFFLATIEARPVRAGALSDANEEAARQEVIVDGLLVALPAPYDRALERFLSGDAQRTWETFRTAVADSVDQTPSGAVGPDFVEAGLRSEDRLDFYADLRRNLNQSLLQGATSARVDAEDAMRVVAGVALIVFLAIALAATALGRRMVANLEVLGARAKRIAAGDLQVEPLALRGSDETASLGHAFDEMTATMRTLQERVSALARGETDDRHGPVPGPLGEDLDRSIAGIRRLHDRLSTSEELSRSVVETAAEAVLSIDPSGRIVTANHAAAELLDEDLDHVVGARAKTLAAVFPFLADVRVDVTNLDATVRRGGGERHVLVSTRRVGEGDDTITTVFARDISDRIDLESRLAHQADHDGLTDLANRARLLRELEQWAEEAGASRRGFALLFIDVDRFKAVNDGLGHRVGDEVLVGVASRLRSVVRSEDLVSRNGGDEFVVLARSTSDVAAAAVLAERIQDAFREPLRTGSRAMSVSVSIGVAWYDPEADDPAMQLRVADLAMYRAKSSGPGRIRVFDEEMRSWLEQRQRLESELRERIATDGLDVHLQPLVDLDGDRVIGAEVLCRWFRDDGSSVPPNDFIPIAEESSLIIDLGRSVIDRAARILADWAADPELDDLFLSINLSGRHVDRPEVVDDVLSALERWGARADHLMVEITETALLGDLEGAARTVGRLAEAGVRVAVDDFGVGFASLNYLRHLPVDHVKVDRSIVSGVADNDVDAVTVDMLVRLTNVLGMEVVAEGIETDEQRDLLAALGCHIGQGYLFARPMAEADFTHHVRGPGVVVPFNRFAAEG